MADQVGTLDTLRFAAVAQQVKLIEVKPKITHVSVAPKLGAERAAASVANGRPAEESTVAVSRQESNETFESAEHAAEVLMLREQVSFLQEKIHQGEVDRLATERRIREEVATEMKEFL